MSWQFIDPQHSKLWRSMESVEHKIMDKGLVEYRDENGDWQNESPTLKAIRNHKPLDYYWSERFKNWHKWPTRFINDGKNDFL